jgi:hypothetical protein
MAGRDADPAPLRQVKRELANRFSAGGLDRKRALLALEAAIADLMSAA